MNWQLVLTHNRTALLGLIATMLGMMPEGRVITRAARRRVLEILLPSESCVRRLIVIAMRNVKKPTVRKRAAPTRSIPRGEKASGQVPVFDLFDPRRRVETGKLRHPRVPPRVSFFDEWTPRPRREKATDEDELDTASLHRRIAAMQQALDDLPRQARRLARVIARRRQAGNLRVKPMRPGRPPGHRERGKRPVDEMLAGLNYLALWILEEPPPDWVVADGA